MTLNWPDWRLQIAPRIACDPEKTAWRANVHKTLSWVGPADIANS